MWGYVLVGLVGIFLGMLAGFFLGKKVGWHSGCSQCLAGYASALETINAALCFFRPKEGEPYPNPSRVIGSLSSEYQEELRGRGIWKDRNTPPFPRMMSGGGITATVASINEEEAP